MCGCSLEGYIGIMDRSARHLVTEMGWAVEKGSIDVQRPIQDMTLSVVGQSAFGCHSVALALDTAFQSPVLYLPPMQA